MKRTSNKKVWDALKQKQSDYLIQAGWFEESKYDNGAPIGGIAAVQNYGAVINQNVTEKQRKFFMAALGIYLRKTTANLHIVIPPTHFMEKCQEENKEKWRKLIQQAWQSVLLGNITPDKAMEMIGLQIEGDIAKSIAAVNNPPLKENTIKQRRNQYKDKKTTGSLTKRLVSQGIMLDSVSHKVTKQ